MNRPLANLARSIENLSRGERPSPLREIGPTEISELNRRFNQLAGDLHAMEADRAVVLAGVSHDIRTPLTRLRLEIELSHLDEESKASMVEEIDRIDSIVRQFIEYARPPELTIERVDVADVLERLTRAYSRERGEGLLQLQARLEPDLRWQGSNTILQRILANLLDNAIKYGRTPDDGIVRVDLLGRRRGRQIELVVRDHGPGVPHEALERLSRPFARLDSERGGVGGSGLGLAVVSRLARRAGGELVLENAPSRRPACPGEPAGSGLPGSADGGRNQDQSGSHLGRLSEYESGSGRSGCVMSRQAPAGVDIRYIDPRGQHRGSRASLRPAGLTGESRWPRC